MGSDIHCRRKGYSLDYTSNTLLLLSLVFASKVALASLQSIQVYLSHAITRGTKGPLSQAYKVKYNMSTKGLKRKSRVQVPRLTHAFKHGTKGSLSQTYMVKYNMSTKGPRLISRKDKFLGYIHYETQEKQGKELPPKPKGVILSYSRKTDSKYAKRIPQVYNSLPTSPTAILNSANTAREGREACICNEENRTRLLRSRPAAGRAPETMARMLHSSPIRFDQGGRGCSTGEES